MKPGTHQLSPSMHHSCLYCFREKRLAKKYYDKLFKEYCICDLSQWQEKKIAMRWRIDREIVSGKGKLNIPALMKPYR